MRENWLLSEDYKKQFLDFCKEWGSNSTPLEVFLADDRVRTIIENTNEEWKEKALKKLEFSGYATDRPTMVRYYYTLSLIEELIGDLDGKSIIEIGAGYGGQCKVIDELFEIESYTIYDLPEVQFAQTKYLKGITGTNTNVYFPRGLSSIENGDLLIAWCSWSELDKQMKEEYAEKVISKCKQFFICSNYNLEEDKQILSRFFPEIKEYSDDLVMGVLYN